eukprot:Rhum_TRINITY_DN6543_c0_g1::Rhum_TRINITY_DN6543_c0_g1_i1::g.20320::m.20320
MRRHSARLRAAGAAVCAVVALSCVASVQGSEAAALRLYGANTDAGRLDVGTQGRWGALCGAPGAWGLTTHAAQAEAACKHLGFEAAVAAGFWHGGLSDDLEFASSLPASTDAFADVLRGGFDATPSSSPQRCPEGSLPLSVACISKALHHAHPRAIGLSAQVLQNTQEETRAQAARSATNADADTSTCDGSGEALFDPAEAAKAYTYPAAMEPSLRAVVQRHDAAPEAVRRRIAEWRASGVLRVGPLGVALDRERLAAVGALFKGDVDVDANHTLAMRMDGYADVVRDVFLSQNAHSPLHWAMDEPWRAYTAAEAAKLSGGNAAAAALRKDGIAVVHDWGLTPQELRDIREVADKEMKAAVPDKAVSSVVSGGAIVTSRLALPAIDRLLRNETVIDIARSYLGDDVVVSGYKLTKLTSALKSEDQYIASRWHHDRVGRRLKMFIFLHPIDCEEGHPTQVVKGTHNLQYYRTETFESSRFSDDFVTSAYDVTKVCGAGAGAGGGFIFDTHTVHKGTNHGRDERLTVIVEFHNAAKCPYVVGEGMGLPCPSGDSYMLNKRLVKSSFRLPNGAYADKNGRSVAAFEATDGEATTAFHAWRFFPFDVIPPVPPAAVVTNKDAVAEAERSGRVGIKEGVCFYDGALGTAVFGGEDGGACVTASDKVFGEFSLLLAHNKSARASAKNSADDDGRLAALRTHVAAHLTPADAALLQSVSGTSVDALLAAVAAEDASTPGFAAEVLSTERFIATPLNALGLHPFRCLLAQRMVEARRRRFVASVAGDAAYAEAVGDVERWESEGFLLKPFEGGMRDDRLRRILEVITGGDAIQADLSFVERVVTHVAYDTQYQKHVDTFHQAVKLWVYPSTVTAEDGPLHYIPGSNNNTHEKLAWTYDVTAANATLYSVAEPSLRMWGSASERYGLPDPVPVLPLEGTAYTLIIADTSGVHFRGRAPPGTTRVALRPVGGENDGGVTRRSPFRQ